MKWQSKAMRKKAKPMRKFSYSNEKFSNSDEVKRRRPLYNFVLQVRLHIDVHKNKKIYKQKGSGNFRSVNAKDFYIVDKKNGYKKFQKKFQK